MLKVENVTCLMSGNQSKSINTTNTFMIGRGWDSTSSLSMLWTKHRNKTWRNSLFTGTWENQSRFTNNSWIIAHNNTSLLILSLIYIRAKSMKRFAHLIKSKMSRTGYLCSTPHRLKLMKYTKLKSYLQFCVSLPQGRCACDTYFYHIFIYIYELTSVTPDMIIRLVVKNRRAHGFHNNKNECKKTSSIPK